MSVKNKTKKATTMKQLLEDVDELKIKVEEIRDTLYHMSTVTGKFGIDAFKLVARIQKADAPVRKTVSARLIRARTRY